MTTEDVTYYSEGELIEATLHRPERDGEVPAVVMCHGFMGVKEWILPIYAEAFADAGYAALRFNYRGFGESGGQRGLALPQNQVEDVRNSITFLETRDRIADDRIGIYGQGGTGGAVASYVPAVDDRPSAMVCSIGIGDGEKWLHDMRREYEWVDFLERLREDRRQRVLTGESELVDPTEEMMISPPERGAKLTGDLKKTDEILDATPDEVPLRVADGIIEFKPVEVAHKISPCAPLWICV